MYNYTSYIILCNDHGYNAAQLLSISSLFDACMPHKINDKLVFLYTKLRVRIVFVFEKLILKGVVCKFLKKTVLLLLVFIWTLPVLHGYLTHFFNVSSSTVSVSLRQPKSITHH